MAARRRVMIRDGVRVVCVAALLVVLGAFAVVGAATHRRIFDERDVPPMQTALVFGAGVEDDGSPSAMLGERLDVAVRLYRTGKVQRLLLSADDLPNDRETPAMLARILAAGVPRDRVLVDNGGFSTRNSCSRARTVFGLRSATLVTQAYHLPRALFVCLTYGVDGVGVGASDWGNYTIATMLPHTLRETVGITSAALRALLRRSVQQG
ncbi:MAG: YdcF family protein [Candidatus Eremiobacteraeota bacterium]|nr:YdcF family protein [Candidatus Eremiobacteraeota bacterium]